MLSEPKDHKVAVNEKVICNTVTAVMSVLKSHNCDVTFCDKITTDRDHCGDREKAPLAGRAVAERKLP